MTGLIWRDVQCDGNFLVWLDGNVKKHNNFSGCRNKN